MRIRGWRKSAALLGLLSTLCTPVVHAQMEQPGQREREEYEQQNARPPPRLTRPPRIIHQQAPVYPESARAERRAGAVVMLITIDEEGYVSRVDVQQSAGGDLDEAAMGAVCNFVFEPAEVDDVPAPIQITYKQTFVLQEEVRQVPVAPPLPVDTPLPSTEAPPTVATDEPPPEETGPVNFRGIIRESGTKDALADAEIIIIGEDESDMRVVTADAAGRFEARGIPPGLRLIRVAHTGHETYSTTEEFSANEVVEVRYFLPRRSYNKFETVVRDRKATKEVNRIALSREEVTAIPGTFGDPLRVIENLPGMARAPFLGGALLVRGTSPRSSGVYVDGVQVPLLYHFGGLTSIISPEYLESIEFYPGGFGAKYGRATAGIVDVKTRAMRMRDCRGYMEVDLMDSGFYFGCPVTLFGPEVASDAPNWRRVTFGFGARRSWIDAVIPLATSLFLPPGAGTITIAPIYWDYQGKVEWRPLAAHTFSLLAFGSDDILKIVAGGSADANSFGFGLHQQFHRLVGRWDWRIGPRMTNQFQVYGGINWNDTSFALGSLGRLGSGDITRIVGVRNELRYTLLEDLLSVSFGLDYTLAETEFDSALPFSGFGEGRNPDVTVQFPRLVQRPGSGGILELLTSSERIREKRIDLNMAPYVDAEIGPIAGFKFIPGFRFDYYKYGRETREFHPTPRMTVKWEPVKDTVLKGSWGIYTQAPTPQEVSPNLGQPRLLPERAIQYVVGAEQRLTSKITVAINGFYSDRSSLVTQSSRVLGITNGVAEFERYNNQGTGNVIGADFMLRHELSKNFFGWIAYTLSKSMVRARPADDEIPFTYDQTHILTIVGQYKIPWHLPFREWAVNGRLPRNFWWNTGWAILSGDWSVGGRFRLVSGNPTTRYVFSSHDLDNNQFIGEYGLANGSRLPMFHQLDIRVDYKMAFNNWLVNVYLDLLNVYNRQNAEFLQWDYRYKTSTPIALLPFLPVLGFTAEF